MYFYQPGQRSSSFCDSSNLTVKTYLIAILCHEKMDSPRNITKSYLTAGLIKMMDNMEALDDWRQLDFTHIM